jgi:hypothetical protein
LLLVLTDGALLLREGADIGVLNDASEVGVLVYCDVWIDLHGFGGLVGVSNVKRVFNLFLLIVVARRVILWSNLVSSVVDV